MQRTKRFKWSHEGYYTTATDEYFIISCAANVSSTCTRGWGIVGCMQPTKSNNDKIIALALHGNIHLLFITLIMFHGVSVFFIHLTKLFISNHPRSLAFFFFKNDNCEQTARSWTQNHLFCSRCVPVGHSDGTSFKVQPHFRCIRFFSWLPFIRS